MASPQVQFDEHGGRLRRAADRYGIPLGQWLDLSTGISPHAWTVEKIPADIWQRLPEDEDGLDEAMSAHFGTTNVLAVAGSQAAIQALPRLRSTGRVGVVMPAYAEHAKAWQAAGHTMIPLATSDVEAAVDTLDVLLVVNPNNPTGEVIEPGLLRQWQRRLAERRGWLLVDEAFVDADPRTSVAAFVDQHLIVLRSLGKFWGLAGVRAGFVLAAPEILANLRAWLGPWHVSHPARWIAQHALLDRAWAEQTRLRLQRDSERLAALLGAHGLPTPSGCSLFRWVSTAKAAQMFDAFARHGVLIRAFSEHGGVRLALPGSESAWQKLEATLRDVVTEVAP
jgi:cobalamin biosynthesis protein CobC